MYSVPYPMKSVGRVLISTELCDAWPVRRQTYGYLPSRRASLPVRRYQILLPGDRGTLCANNLPKVVTLKRVWSILSRKSNVQTITPAGRTNFLEILGLSLGWD